MFNSGGEHTCPKERDAQNIRNPHGFFQRAVEVDPSNERAKLALAQAQIDLGGYAASLYILEGIPTEGRRALWHALRVRALVADGRSGEVDEDVRSAMRQVAEDEVESTGNSIAESLLRGGRADVIDPVRHLLARGGETPMLHLHCARVAALRGEDETAEREYEAAAGTVTGPARDEIEFEFAQFLARKGEFERAASLCEGSGYWRLDEQAAQSYARTLHRIGEWDRLSGLLEHLGAQGELPAWALDLRSRFALEYDDIAGALADLDRLVELDRTFVYLET